MRPFQLVHSGELLHQLGLVVSLCIIQFCESTTTSLTHADTLRSCICLFFPFALQDVTSVTKMSYIYSIMGLVNPILILGNTYI